jgi:hypothetical protein
MPQPFLLPTTNFQINSDLVGSIIGLRLFVIKILHILQLSTKKSEHWQFALYVYFENALQRNWSIT